MAEDQSVTLRISCDVDDDSWIAAANQPESFNQPVAPWQEWTPFTEVDLQVIGPDGLAWFEVDSRRIGYSGALLYLAAKLCDWQPVPDTTFVIEPDLIYQTAPVAFKVLADTVEITFGRHDRCDSLSVPLSEAQRAVADFLEQFGTMVVAHLPSIRDVVTLAWLPAVRNVDSESSDGACEPRRVQSPP